MIFRVYYMKEIRMSWNFSKILIFNCLFLSFSLWKSCKFQFWQNHKSWNIKNSIWIISRVNLTLFKVCSGNTLRSGGGAIMAWIGFRHPEAVRRQPKAQKWIVFNFFDLLLSIDTMNNSLWTIILAVLTVKGLMEKITKYQA